MQTEVWVMTKDTKEIVDFAETFGALEVRLGRVIEVSPTTSNGKPAYLMAVDFGKFGKHQSVGRFTWHAIDDVKGRLVVGVLNLGTKSIDGVESSALILGVQVPKAESGEATFLTPAHPNPKIGGKVF